MAKVIRAADFTPAVPQPRGRHPEGHRPPVRDRPRSRSGRAQTALKKETNEARRRSTSAADREVPQAACASSSRGTASPTKRSRRRSDPRGRGGGRAGQGRADRREPPPRRLDRQEVHQPRPAVPRPDPGGEHRPDEGGREVRVPPRLQVLDVRDVVDPPGDHARDRRPGAHDPHPGAHDRDDQQADPHLALARAGARPRAHRRGDRRSGWTCPSPRCARS